MSDFQIYLTVESALSRCKYLGVKVTNLGERLETEYNTKIERHETARELHAYLKGIDDGNSNSSCWRNHE